MPETVTDWNQLKHGDKITVDGVAATFYGAPYRYLNGQRIPGEVFAVADTYNGKGDWLYWSWATMLRTNSQGEHPTWKDVRPKGIEKSNA